MDVQIARDPFFRALQLVQNVVESRQTLPILANVLIESADGGIRLAATDLEVTARVSVPAEVRAPGSVTLAARKLLELVRELPAQPITLALRESGWVQVVAGSARFKLVGLPAEEYPPLAMDSAGEWVAVPGATLRAALAQTVYAMSSDDSRPVLNGLHVALKERELRLVATDGHRLALARLPSAADGEMAGVVPRKAVQEMVRVMAGTEEAALAIRENQFFLRTPGFDLASKLLEGQFPGYEPVVPRAHPKRLTVERAALLAAVRRVAVVADDRTRPVRLTAEAGAVRLTAQSPELGEAEETLPADYDGDQMTIGFNARYLLDALAPMEGERTVVELKDALSPGLFRSAADDAHLCVIMPMRM